MGMLVTSRDWGVCQDQNKFERSKVHGNSYTKTFFLCGTITQMLMTTTQQNVFSRRCGVFQEVWSVPGGVECSRGIQSVLTLNPFENQTQFEYCCPLTI
jgi:hypothetical protein